MLALNYSHPAWRDAYDFLRITLGVAGRVDEVLGLRWQDVNFKTSTIKTFSAKTSKEKVLQLPTVVAIILQRKKDELGSDTHVFDRPDHKVRQIFKRASMACDLIYSQRRNGGWTIHDLRATALTHLLESGVDLATVSSKFAQHTNLAETTRYLRPSKSAQEKAAEASNLLVNFATSLPDDM